jgi:hypothetical protein
MWSSNGTEAASYNKKATDAVYSFKYWLGEVADSVAKTDLAHSAPMIVKNAEKFYRHGCQFVSDCMPLIKASTGTLLLLKGGKLAKTVLIFQSLKVSGLPVIKRAVDELAQAYTRTRAKFDEEMPKVLAMKKELGDVMGKVKKIKADIVNSSKDMKKIVKKAQADLKSAKITQEEFTKQKETAMQAYTKQKDILQDDIKALMEMKKKVDTASSSVKQILSALEPDHLKSILSQSYASLLSALAVAKSGTAQSITMGLHFGTFIVTMFTSLLQQYVL